MDWIDRFIVIGCTLATVLTLRHLARTILIVMSRPAEPTASPSPGIGPVAVASPRVRVWADDVLAEEEQEARATRGAADHASDVCTFWDEEDERQAQSEAVDRLSRSLLPPD